MERGSGTVFGVFIGNLNGYDRGQLGRIDAVNPDRRAVDTIATEGTGKLFITDFFMRHKAFAFGTDPLALDYFFAGIAGTHSVSFPFLGPESADSWGNSSLFLA
jgi:hypothetical protein